MGGSAPREGCRLPVGTTGFVDRRDERAAGRGLSAEARRVTFTGPGEVGRGGGTRLAARAAARAERALPAGHRCAAGSRSAPARFAGRPVVARRSAGGRARRALGTPGFSNRSRTAARVTARR
ncbi:hypothetical protein [Streptomyces sp. NPDC008092]|uniref:hypothetical protein n=1 Tax=Streptomyces sp. NPDC008092 TaxID=3364808 RepID=UPI0036EFDA50